MYNTILDFWFNEIEPSQWWKVDPEFDAFIDKRFSDLYQKANCAELVSWRSEAKGRLAEVIILDQFSRNIFRGKPAAFSQDTSALILAQEAVRLGCLDELAGAERSFLLMPYMHSESAFIHTLAEPLFKRYAPNNYAFEVRHKEIIDRFGRYPHRNEILARQSTAEEVEFLKQPGSSF